MKKEKSNIDLPKHDLKGWIKAFILGVFIGLAIIVPGISGSTVAIMFGLYAALLYAIGNILGDFKRCVAFLVPIAVGAVIGFAVGFLLVQVLLEKYMFVVICLFVGLMIGASPALLNEIKGEKPNARRAILMGIGVLIPIAIAVISILTDPPSLMADAELGAPQPFESFPPYLFVLYVPLGILIAATQLIPGLSATAIMMAFGQFKPIMDSMHLDYILENPMFIALIGCLLLGAIIGLVLISKMFSKLIEKYRGTTFFFVIGLSFGSIASMFFNPDTAQIYFNWGHGGFSGGEFAIGLVLLALGALASGLIAKYELMNVEKKEQAEKHKNDEIKENTDKESE